MAKHFRLLDVARAVADELNSLMDKARPRFLYEDQLRESSGSIVANIREAFGRRRGPERTQFFRYARGSTEESHERLRANFAVRRVDATHYWRLHNRFDVIRKMLDALIQD